MTKKQLEEFKDLLNERLSELVDEAHNTVGDLIEGEENFPDPTDRATAESDRNFLLRIRDRERRLILKIREALERIEDGTFGECENCGENIGVKRLRARPVTTLCIDCKTEMESIEKSGN
ncbi:MAG: RNA polymerase-binding protein DksA [Deltaproteobacteria bacterium]|nr:MAG: RNA polymerase-binding protein DksA [Deltaproteobacteria bacterium]